MLRNTNLFNIPFICLVSQRNFTISNIINIENENNDFTFENSMTKKQFSLKLKEYFLEQLELVCNRENSSECS